jgi:hypothetical protein
LLFNHLNYIRMNNWTVVLHFDRGQSTIYNELSQQKAQELVNIAVFFNKDCVNASIFQSTINLDKK